MMSEGAENYSVNNLFCVTDKVVVITGGTSGLGLMMAQGLLENGAEVVIASRKQQRCSLALEQLAPLGRVSAVTTDIANTEGRNMLVDYIASECGTIDVLINNAGTNFGAELEDYPDAGFEKVINTNLNAVFSLTRDLVPYLAESASASDPSRVINIGSMDGIHVPIVQRVPTFAYSTSKAALHHLTRTLAVHLAPKHITVNAVAPGFFASRMTDYVFEHYLDDIEADCPLKRTGKSEEIVGIVIYLMSAAGAYTNGTTIPVDGGTSISKGHREWM
ncbi:MAG: SDR family oxidoreductase [Gammaproteobacteria bacterium]|nr:SDR family oxidoreductase [Gammaproteobacteria bacterium]MCY4357529.1 SDR family oxidoreductase [Gammaproteobacteria bacterium]